MAYTVCQLESAALRIRGQRNRYNHILLVGVQITTVGFLDGISQYVPKVLI